MYALLPRRLFSSLPEHLQGGRSSVSGISATVFGATGFLGRYVVNRLGRVGSQVLVPFRGEEEETRHLRLLGDLGQIVPARFDPKSYESILSMVEQSNVVINLIGRTYETNNFKFQDVNIKIPEMIAQACREAGVEKLVHVSALGASEDHASEFLRTKLIGERNVRATFPSATVIRPGQMYGAEDKFLNLFAQQHRVLRYLPLVNRGLKKLQPVYVGDIAEAIVKIITDRSTDGKVYELAGEEVLTWKEIMEDAVEQTGHKPRLLPIPNAIASLWARALEMLPNPPLSREQVLIMRSDVVVSKNALTFRDLGIQPSEFDRIAPSYLRRYRTARMINLDLE